MKQFNNDFFIPYYIFEEIVEYIEDTAKGNPRTSKWDNIKALLNLAVINDSLSKNEAEFLKNEFNREKV